MTLYFKEMMDLKAGETKNLVLSGKKEHLKGSAVIKLNIDGHEEVYAFS